MQHMCWTMACTHCYVPHHPTCSFALLAVCQCGPNPSIPSPCTIFCQSHQLLCSTCCPPPLPPAATVAYGLPQPWDPSAYFYVFVCRKPPLSLHLDSKLPGALPAGWSQASRQELARWVGDKICVCDKAKDAQHGHVRVCVCVCEGGGREGASHSACAVVAMFMAYRHCSHMTPAILLSLCCSLLSKGLVVDDAADASLPTRCCSLQATQGAGIES